MALKEAIDACTDPDMKRTLQDAYNAEYDKLGNMNARYNSFCDENGVPRLADRLQVAEWNYREAMKAYEAGTVPNNGLTETANSGTIRVKEAPSASLRFLNHMDGLFRNAEKIKPIEGYEDIVCHADKIGFAFRDSEGRETNISANDLAEMIKKSGEYYGGAVRLIACEAGADDAISGQALANALGKDVMAPSDIVYVYENGEMVIGPTPTSNTGRWVVFHPKGLS